MADKKLVKIVRYPHLHKFFAGIALVTFVVNLIAGVSAQARFFTIAWKIFWCWIAVSAIAWVVMKVIASYEEMKGGEA